MFVRGGSSQTPPSPTPQHQTYIDDMGNMIIQPSVIERFLRPSMGSSLKAHSLYDYERSLEAVCEYFEVCAVGSGTGARSPMFPTGFGFTGQGRASLWGTWAHADAHSDPRGTGQRVGGGGGGGGEHKGGAGAWSFDFGVTIP